MTTVSLSALTPGKLRTFVADDDAQVVGDRVLCGCLSMSPAMMLSGGTRVERSSPSCELRGVETPATPSNATLLVRKIGVTCSGTFRLAFNLFSNNFAYVRRDLKQPDRPLPQGFVLRLHDRLVIIAEHYAEGSPLDRESGRSSWTKDFCSTYSRTAKRTKIRLGMAASY